MNYDMEEQLKKIIQNGEKEKKGGIIILTILGIFTTLIAIISIFAYEILPLLGILAVIDLLFVLMIVDGNNHIKNPQKYIQNSNISGNSINNSTETNLDSNEIKTSPVFTSYKSKWVWDDAAKEYLQLTGKDNVTDLNEEENDKIYEYASMPAIYFFMWLIDNEFMTDNFYKDYKEEQISKLKKHETSPVDFFVYNMDCSLVRDDIANKILPFVDNYFEVDNKKGYINFSNWNLSDYYECIKNSRGTIFCNDFSWDIYAKIADKINSAVEKFAVIEKMCNWLEYPTELGKRPIEIEITNKFEYYDNQLICYILKYKKDLNSNWMLGIVSDTGVFSEMKEYREENEIEDARVLVNFLVEAWKAKNNR